MIPLKKNFFIAIVFLLTLACSKSEDPEKKIPVKCANKTILDELLSGQQMYILAKVSTTQVLLNLKDKKGKARAFGPNINPVLYEWDLQTSSVSDTQVKLIAGEIIAIQGIFVPGLYFPDSFFFKDDNCKITGEASDGQTINTNPILFENITNSSDLKTVLEKFRW